MKYRKKPVEIDAIRWDGENINEIFEFCQTAYTDYGTGHREVKIQTLEGPMSASVGDYIIKGVKGEFYPCKPDIFEMTYEKVENE